MIEAQSVSFTDKLDHLSSVNAGTTPSSQNEALINPMAPGSHIDMDHGSSSPDTSNILCIIGTLWVRR